MTCPGRAASGQTPRIAGAVVRRFRSVEPTCLPADAAGMAKKPEPPTTIVWKVYKIASKAAWLGEVKAPDEATAMEKAAAEFKVPANRLIALRR
jgi:hypothetical protein